VKKTQKMKKIQKIKKTQKMKKIYEMKKSKIDKLKNKMSVILFILI